MYRRAHIPQSLVDKAKRLNPNAALPKKPGEGTVVSSYFMRDVNAENLYYFATAKTYDGKLYLIHHTVERPLVDTLPNIILQSPYLLMTWDESGKILEWVAGQPK